MQLDAALAAAELTPHVDLNYWVPQQGGSILQAFYWCANERIEYDRVYVRAGCVRSEHRRDAATVLTCQGLPRFVIWVRTLVALPKNSPILQQQPFFDATFEGASLRVHHNPSKLLETTHQES